MSCFPGSPGSVPRLELLKRGEDLNHALREAIEEWQPTREKTIPMLADMADNIDNIRNRTAKYSFLDSIREDFKRAFDGIDKIIAELNIEEAQKHVNKDESATRKVIVIINDIKELVNQMTYLETQPQKAKMFAILLNVDPEGIRVARKGAELVFNIEEMAVTLGGLLDQKAGWIAIWVGELTEEMREAVTTVNAKIGEMALRLGSSDLEVATDVGIEINLFSLDIKEVVNKTNLTIFCGKPETKAADDLREKATNYKKQMEKLLAAVNKEMPDAVHAQ